MDSVLNRRFAHLTDALPVPVGRNHAPVIIPAPGRPAPGRPVPTRPIPTRPTLGRAVPYRPGLGPPAADPRGLGPEPLGRPLPAPPPEALGRLVGASQSTVRLRTRLLQFAQVEAPVMVLGETGAGKDLAAELLHRAGPRHAGPYVCLNCAALSGDLVESELFGSVAGAFTGARARPGLFVQADGGTLFLDEVGELTPAAQAALLRVLETGAVRAVGAATDRKVEVRIVCATHRDLKRAVREGRFRADLYHRLAALRIDIAPLRHRAEDVPAIVAALKPDIAARLAPDAVRMLMRHTWPGNVRELRNVLFRLEAEVPQGRIHALDLEFDTPIFALPTAGGLEAATAAAVHAELARHQGNVRRTASALGCSRTTVYRYLDRHQA